MSSPPRFEACGKRVAVAGYVSGILWVTLVLVLMVATATCLAYRRELAAARERTLLGSRIQETGCGPIEYGTFGEGSPILVLHGTSGGWDQGIAAARGLVGHGFQLIAPSRFGYLRTPLPVDPSPQAEADTWAGFLDALQISRLPVIAFSAGAAPAVQLALRHPNRVSALVLIVPGAGGLVSEPAIGPPTALLDAIYRFDFPMWAIMRVAPTIMHRLVAVPPALVRSLRREDRARLDEAVRMILPVSARRLGVLNEGKTQGSARQYPLERISVPTLLISAADDLYRTLPNARQAATLIPHARLIDFATGGHLLLGRANEVWPAVATFLQHEAIDQPFARSGRTSPAQRNTDSLVSA
jgi:2-hydroxy-6-oxonona-2,4-dienedioate hydrolase